jgi:hypothetical protein
MTSTIDYDALAAKHGAPSPVDYDALAQKHGAATPPASPTAPPANGLLPSGFSVPSVNEAKDRLHAVQQGAQPDDGMVAGALRNFGAGGADFVQHAGHVLTHPIDAMNEAEAEENAKPMSRRLLEAIPGSSLPGLASSLIHQPMRTLGNLGTGAIVGDAVGEGIGAGIRAPGQIRAAAIGDTDAAALRGLRVPPNGKKVLPMQGSVQTARPYLQGSSSLEDLQGRIGPAKDEIFQPYRETLDAVGDRPVRGPDGMTTIRALEDERQELSAMNRGLRTGDPSALRLAEQKGMSQSESLARERSIQAHLDPALSDYGIDPQGIRQAYGSVARIGNQVEGRSTLLEKPQPSGFGKIGQISLKQPFQAPGQILSGIRDLVAGRPAFSMSPSDVGIREGFAKAGPKPDFGRYTPVQPTGLLGRGATPMGAPPEVSGPPEGYRPPPFYHDTDAMRTGRLLASPAAETPMSSHADIFPDQLPGGATLKREPEIISPKKKDLFMGARTPKK